MIIQITKKYYWCVSIIFFGYLQAQTSQLATVGFYNVENLFDTIDDARTYDQDFSPKGKYHWTTDDYQQKLKNIAKVISLMTNDISQSPPDILGLAEIENERVLKDLIAQEKLATANYSYIHINSPDIRGIDVALLYKKSLFVPIDFKAYPLFLMNKEKRIYTRDQLLIKGRYEEEIWYLLINHWPSRRGGAKRSASFRMQAALLNKKIIDSIREENSKAKVIVMGDFNDNPDDDSFKKGLQTVNKIAGISKKDLFNPFEKIFEKGIGSMMYRGESFLFDQIYMSSTFVSTTPHSKGFKYWKLGIYNPTYLTNQEGKYKGYPFRAMSRTGFVKGYSDHYPIYICLINDK